VGVVYAQRERARTLRPHIAGWLGHSDSFDFLSRGAGLLRYDKPLRDDALMLEQGTFNAVGCAALEAAVDLLLALGVEAIHTHVNGLLDPLEAGLEIYAEPPGKKLSALSLLSGGEQALTALSLIFAVFRCNPAPVCVLDEVDAPLDDANVERFCNLLEDMVRVIELRPTERSPTGQYNALANAYATLSIFYRQAPRGFFPRVFIGVEGDRQKSVEWINKAVEAEPNNVMYAKEQGIALMCLAHQEEDAINQELRQKSIAAFKRAIGLRARNWLDRVDQEHSRLFVENPKIEKMSCKYNRDGFEETESKDFEADKKRAEEEAKAKAAAPTAATPATTTR
jgi:hypothetical protein